MGGMKDLSGNSRNLVHTGGSNADISMRGLHFNGNADYLIVKDFDYETDATFTVSFWFTKEKCTGNVYEYLYSDHKSAAPASMWSLPYLDIYMGCHDKKAVSGSPSIVRYWMR
eukprot:SAG25_NODE_8163_length_436_cov_0.765579_1_plen_112_part_01